MKDPTLLAELSEEDLEALRAMSDEDLAPPPSNEDIFGKVDALKGQFQEENERINKQFKENQARVQGNLQEKLMMRKQRRARKNMDKQEAQAYKQRRKEEVVEDVEKEE
ncbi:uncharacterized protein LOC111701531 [Eurytemora carolleeae]|uniref:uncharacterized protein LOC111701531 n=1 Tax=Eurytemora carolleeae TaxID=1294199 RepID=UPI000C7793F1|nr:uncharacterized protein LOC111701531 [Eurytemora carolleeae]|eukprot:XP_023328608.1 uncharacterized protein LOC111701531 [Eurytemora affinis]